jgi:ABC-2 type transport system ATP-binding protein
MRQRLEIAQALLGDPELLLLDEPLGWLEPAGRSEILELLARLRGSVAMVVATADVALAEATCDSVAVLDQGRLLATSPTTTLLDRAAPRDYILETAAGPGQAGSGLGLAGLSARLRLEPWVRELTPSDGTLRIAVRDPERAERELMTVIVSTGLSVGELRRERPGVGAVVDRLKGNGA